MKENFEKALQSVKEISDKNPEPVNVDEEIASSLENVGLEEMIPGAARVTVLELQKEKNSIMDWLHRELACIDRGEGVESCNLGENFFVVNKDLQSEGGGEVTAGELITDGEWGIKYKLLPEVPRNIKKHFVVAEARRLIGKLLDKQICVSEVKREIPKWIDGPMKDYMKGINACYNSVLSPGYEKSHTTESGFIAEKLASTYLEAFQIDNDAPYQFTRGDAFDDFERKIDFYIHIPAHARGVKTQVAEREDIGIQFTVNPGHKRAEHKLEQIQFAKAQFGLNDIDDIVLVSISLKHSEGCYKKWLDGGKMPGGPARYLPEAMREEIFFGVLDNFFEVDSVLEMWDNRKVLKDVPKTEQQPDKRSRTAMLRNEVRRWWKMNGHLVDRFTRDPSKEGEVGGRNDQREEKTDRNDPSSSRLRGFWRER